MKTFLKKNAPIIILLILAIFTRIAFLVYPAELVFDEVYFGKFASAYFNHKYYFDIHPPLGKLMIAGFAGVFGFKDADFSFAKIGEAFSAKNLFILRFLPAFFGTLFILLVYLLILALDASKKAAIFGAFLALFDNAMLTQSKFILLDMILISFGLLAFYLFVLSRKEKNFSRKQTVLLIISAISAAFAVGIKWTGISFMGLIFLFMLYDLARGGVKKNFAFSLVIFSVVPILVYISIFAIHFKLLNLPGPGDAYMSTNFQTKTFFGKFTELNGAMYSYSAGLKATHPYGSKWYEWPFMQKSIWYWTKNINGAKANIYLLGNPFVWFGVFVSIVVAFFGVVFRKFRKNFGAPFYILLLGYFANLLPYIFISRVAFLYHYLPALTLGILISSLLIHQFYFEKSKSNILLIYSLFLFSLFLFFSFLIFTSFSFSLFSLFSFLILSSFPSSFSLFSLFFR